MKRLGFTLLAALLIACFVILIRSHDTSESTPHAHAHVHAHARDREQAQPAATAGAHNSSLANAGSPAMIQKSTTAATTKSQPPITRAKEVLSAEEEASWRASLPRRDTAQREVSDDPHTTPHSLIQLAPVFAALMKNARESADQARSAFAKFAVCARDTEEIYPSSLKVSCFVNAKVLATDHPGELARAFSELSSSLDDSTRKLAEAYDSL